MRPFESPQTNPCLHHYWDGRDRTSHSITQMRSRNFGLQLTGLPESKEHHSDICSMCRHLAHTVFTSEKLKFASTVAFPFQLTDLPDSKRHHNDSCFKIVKAGTFFSFISTDCPTECRMVTSKTTV